MDEQSNQHGVETINKQTRENMHTDGKKHKLTGIRKNTHVYQTKPQHVHEKKQHANEIKKTNIHTEKIENV